MNRRAMTNRDDFEYWLIDMDDALEHFLAGLPAQVREALDFSPSSLDTLEAWILEKYPNAEAMIEGNQAQIVDGIARYVGETFRRVIGGYWDIELDNPKVAFFGVPILIGFEEHSTPICPLALSIASADRRTGKFLRTVLGNIMKQLGHAKL